MVRVLGTGRIQCNDRSHTIIAASRGGGDRSNSGLSGLFRIFPKNILLKCTVNIAV